MSSLFLESWNPGILESWQKQNPLRRGGLYSVFSCVLRN